MTANKTQADRVNPNDQRANRPMAFSSGDGIGAESLIGKLGMQREL